MAVTAAHAHRHIHRPVSLKTRQVYERVCRHVCSEHNRHVCTRLSEECCKSCAYMQPAQAQRVHSCHTRAHRCVCGCQKASTRLHRWPVHLLLSRKPTAALVCADADACYWMQFRAAPAVAASARGDAPEDRTFHAKRAEVNRGGASVCKGHSDPGWVLQSCSMKCSMEGSMEGSMECPDSQFESSSSFTTFWMGAPFTY